MPESTLSASSHTSAPDVSLNAGPIRFSPSQRRERFAQNQFSSQDSVTMSTMSSSNMGRYNYNDKSEFGTICGTPGSGSADSSLNIGNMTNNSSARPNLDSAVLHIHCDRIFDVLKDDNTNGSNSESEYVSKSHFLDELTRRGILVDDPRIRDTILHLKRRKNMDRLDRNQFRACIASNISLMEQVFGDDLIIPNFDVFVDEISEIFEQVEKNCDGDMADYIPCLAKQNPDHFGVAVCTVSGQRTQLGDCDIDFCIQSCSKPITYCMALEQQGQDTVHKHVGREPSGEEFNALKLNKEMKPHNPLINSGAIMTCSLICQGMEPSDRFDYVTKQWASLAGNKPLGYSNSVYLSERNTADRNYALAYFMNENKGFPPGTKLQEVLEFYFQCCSLMMNADQLSIVAATLANGGINPLTDKQVLRADTVRNCLSVMYSCGMYDYSGEFAFKIGLPAKSGVAGGVFVVVPNVAGFATYSPNLDQYGNSVRGVDFFERLVSKFNFHNFDCLSRDLKLGGKRDPCKRELPPNNSSSESQTQTQSSNSTKSKGQNETDNGDVNNASSNSIASLCHQTSTNEYCDEMLKHCSLGDLSSIKRLFVRGITDFDCGDYDHRSPLHLAASNGHLHVIKFMVEQKLVKNLSPIDRWGGTPTDDAEQENHIAARDYLILMGGKKGPQRRRSQILKGVVGVVNEVQNKEENQKENQKENENQESLVQVQGESELGVNHTSSSDSINVEQNYNIEDSIDASELNSKNNSEVQAVTLSDKF